MFTLRTDQNALKWILSHPGSAKRLGRFLLQISELAFDVIDGADIKIQSADFPHATV